MSKISKRLSDDLESEGKGVVVEDAPIAAGSATPTITSDPVDLAKEPESASPPAPEQAVANTNPHPHSITHPPMSLAHEVVFVVVIVSAQLLAQCVLGQSIAPSQFIASSFGNSEDVESTWFPAAFSLTTGTFILVSGRLGDIYGHKRFLLLGYSWSSLWALIAGCSAYTHNQIFFDICRAMQGLGGALTLPNGIALLGATYPPSHRKSIVFSIFGGLAPIGFVIGATMASLIAERAWWPWAFWSISIAFALLVVGVWFVVPTKGREEHHEPQSFDWVGAFTGVSGLVLFNVAWNLAPDKGWGSPETIVLLILGILSFAAFIVVEFRVEQPIVPLRGMSAKVALILSCIMLGWSSFGIWIYYFYQISLELQHNTALLSSAMLVPVTIMGFAAAVLVAYIVHRIKASWIMLAAMGAFCVGNILFATLPVDRLYWKQVFWSMVIMPFGMDLSFPAASLLMSNAVEKKQQGVMASLVLTTVNYAAAFGLGIAGTVESHVNGGGHTPEDILLGYRGAFYTAVGLAGMGVLLAMGFVFSDYHREWRAARKDTDQDEKPV